MRLVMRAFPLLLLAGLPACVSLDPTADISSAAEPVTLRAADPGWSQAWNEPSDAWDGVAPLSSDAAVRVALRNNRKLRGAVEAIVAARADYVQAHLLPNPIISVAIGFPTDSLGGEPLGAALVQQLAWLWRRPAAIDSADAALRTQILTVSDTALRVVADVRRAHARVVFAERAIAIGQDNVDVTARSVDLGERLLAAGEASRLDLNRLILDRERARTALTDQEAELAIARRDLLELLACAGADATWGTDDVVRGADEAGDLGEDAVVALATAQRLDVAAAAAAYEGGLARLAFANQGKLPDVSAGVEYRQNFSSRPGVFPLVSVTPKLFDDNSARIARATSELVQAEIEADRVRQQAIAETRRAWIALAAERRVVGSYEQEVVTRVEESLRLARAALGVGESDMTSVLAEERRLNDVRLELVARRHAAATALFELERAVGGALSADEGTENGDDPRLSSRPEQTPVAWDGSENGDEPHSASGGVVAAKGVTP